MNEDKKARRRVCVRLIVSLVIYAAITVLIAVCYRRTSLTERQGRLIQNGAYAAMLLGTLGAMKKSGERFCDYGLFLHHAGVQLLIGAAAGAGIELFGLMFGRLPSLPDEWLYTSASQLLVAASEEIFWRGWALENARRLFSSKDAAVFFSALLFALWHLPVHFNLAQLIYSFVTGALFAVLRVEFGEKAGLLATTAAHWIANVF